MSHPTWQEFVCGSRRVLTPEARVELDDFERWLKRPKPRPEFQSWREATRLRACPECKEETRSGHLVPASMGDGSFWICESINRIEQCEGMGKSKAYPPALSGEAQKVKT